MLEKRTRSKKGRPSISKRYNTGRAYANWEKKNPEENHKIYLGPVTYKLLIYIYKYTSKIHVELLDF